MRVELVHYTPLNVCSDAIRTCWQSQDKSDSGAVYYCNKCDTITYEPEVNWLQQPYCSECGSTDGAIRYEIGENDKKLINKVGNKNKHSSTLEHLTYNFHIYDISRALLQELARHRIASLSVKSTRYTLKELKNEEHFMNGWSITDDVDDVDWNGDGYNRACKYLVMTGDSRVDLCSIGALDNLRELLLDGISNDKAKYAMPEAYRTELAWTVNARSLQNFLMLRSSPHALWEIRELAQTVFDAIPEDHKYLFVDSIYKPKEDLSQSTL